MSDETAQRKHHADCVCHGMDQVPDDIRAAWPEGEAFVKSNDLIEALARYAPRRWSEESCYGRALTVQRLGRYLSNELGIRSSKNHRDERGYCRHDFAGVWGGVIPGEPVKTRFSSGEWVYPAAAIKSWRSDQ